MRQVLGESRASSVCQHLFFAHLDYTLTRPRTVQPIEEDVALAAGLHLQRNGDPLPGRHRQRSHRFDEGLVFVGFEHRDEHALQFLSCPAAQEKLYGLGPGVPKLGASVADDHVLVLPHQVRPQRNSFGRALRKQILRPIEQPRGSADALQRGPLNIEQELERAAGVSVVLDGARRLVSERGIVIEAPVRHVGPGQRSLGLNGRQGKIALELRLCAVRDPIVLPPAAHAEDVHHIRLVRPGLHHHERTPIQLHYARIGGLRRGFERLDEGAGVEHVQPTAHALLPPGVDHDCIVRERMRKKTEPARVVGVGRLRIPEVGNEGMAV